MNIEIQFVCVYVLVLLPLIGVAFGDLRVGKRRRGGVGRRNGVKGR